VSLRSSVGDTVGLPTRQAPAEQQNGHSVPSGGPAAVVSERPAGDRAVLAAPRAHQHDSHKHGQADHFDHIGSPEFEINRPHGESKLYRYLMKFKFRRAAELLPFPLRGRSVLTVCCGSGMDAEFLERAGARVVALDISIGALERARERAAKYGLSYRVVLGDAEQLPFRTNAFDVSFVHDGLHHLPEPRRAISEMARTAAAGVVITEPADAFLTKLAIALHLIPEREDAGNLVVRFDAASLSRLLAELGFPASASARYLVKYGHPPARWWHLFDQPVLGLLAEGGLLFLGVYCLGRFGNKLSVAAVK